MIKDQREFTVKYIVNHYLIVNYFKVFSCISRHACCPRCFFVSNPSSTYHSNNDPAHAWLQEDVGDSIQDETNPEDQYRELPYFSWNAKINVVANEGNDKGYCP